MLNYIGIDVSMQSLKLFDGKKEYEVPNERGLKNLEESLKVIYGKDWNNVLFIYEPTGPYSNFLKEFSLKHRIEVYEINPKKSSNFAKAIGNRSKTDSIDAKMLYSYHLLIREDKFKVPLIDPITEKLASFLRSYKLIQKMKTMLSNHIHSQKFVDKDNSVTNLSKFIEKELERFSETEAKLEKKIENWVRNTDEIKEDFNNLLSIKGIGVISAIVLLYMFRKYPDTNRAQITALCGLDPVKKESGNSVKGEKRISKAGNPLLRKILYFACMNAIKHNDRINLYYNRLINNRKPGKVALIACMRKLVLIAHQIYVKKEKYRPLVINENI
ncbi:MAG TPA: IS110 family transposase [Caldisericia bacterium]|nr:IS110 family transposase [Caldisericia bacterium]HPO29045.1 IS110 family transposase [Caldisericia bacterium]HQG82488.1 IS110 family transposase [Caldisericia bacterium]